MVGLNYSGPTATAPKHLMKRLSAIELLDTGTTRLYTMDRINTLAQPYATKSYVDLADAGFTTNSFVNAQDALNLPLTAKGVPNGVATLDANSRLPLAQAPNLGVGFLRGPYGATTQITSDTTTATTPVQIAQIVIGVPAITFKPWAFLSAFVIQEPGARAILEMRIGTTAQTAYADQTLIAEGFGRSYYNDYQSITCKLAGNTTGMTPSPGYASSTAWQITAWLYSATAANVTVRNANITTCSAFLLRTAL